MKNKDNWSLIFIFGVMLAGGLASSMAAMEVVGGKTYT